VMVGLLDPRRRAGLGRGDSALRHRAHALAAIWADWTARRWRATLFNGRRGRGVWHRVVQVGARQGHGRRSAKPCWTHALGYRQRYCFRPKWAAPSTRVSVQCDVRINRYLLQ
jgi:hypothetical protein